MSGITTQPPAVVESNDVVSIRPLAVAKLQGSELGETPELLTMTEAAKLLRCSKAHLCNVLKGRVATLPPLAHLSLGRRTLIRRSVLQQWIEHLEESAQREVMS